MSHFEALVLTGGGGRRLGGVDKAGLEIGDQTMLDRALAATSDATTRVVVGPPRALPAGVHQTSEEPAGGGPVAALEAGMALVTQPVVVVLACDMPLVTAEHLRRLVGVLAAAPPTTDAVVYVDETGRRQYLAAAYRSAGLRAALARLGPAHGRAMRELVGLLTVVEVQADAESTADCDTWADVARSRMLLEER